MGGAERQLINLTKGLHEIGHCVSVATFYSGALDSELKEANIPLYNLGKKHRWDIATFFNSLRKLIKSEKPDIIYGYLSSANILTVFLKPLFPSIRSVWGVRASNVELSHYDWLCSFLYFVERKLSRFSDLIITNSRAGLEYSTQKGFQKEKMIFIPNGIETTNFRPQPRLREVIRKKWNVNKNEILIGIVARFDPMKDHITFLKAAALVDSSCPDVRFVCVGSGDAGYTELLRHVSEELGLANKILWVGVQKDMPAVYSSLDILCLSSAGEGFPNVIGEAMACGVPCVATDVGDSAEIVGNAGIVVPPKHCKNLADGLQQMIVRIETEKSIISNQVQERIVEMFGIEKMVLRTEKALSEIL